MPRPADEDWKWLWTKIDKTLPEDKERAWYIIVDARNALLGLPPEVRYGQFWMVSTRYGDVAMAVGGAVNPHGIVRMYNRKVKKYERVDVKRCIKKISSDEYNDLGFEYDRPQVVEELRTFLSTKDNYIDAE